MLKGLIGTKKRMTQVFTEEGRVPVTPVVLGPCVITQIKTEEKDGYNAVQVAYGEKRMKNITKPEQGHLKGAKLEKAPSILLEVEHEDLEGLKVGDNVSLSDIFSEGDVVKVRSKTKGKGFAGAVKRWGFKGAPKSHGHGGILRKVGSIGQGTDPGRVWKGKKMPGRMGNDIQTVKNLKIVKINDKGSKVYIRGSVPGSIGDFIMVTRTSDKQNLNESETAQGDNDSQE